MNLNTLRHMKLLRGGEIRAWAMTETSFKNVLDELDMGHHTWSSDCRLLDYPVVIVRPGEPEGVIV